MYVGIYIYTYIHKYIYISTNIQNPTPILHEHLVSFFPWALILSLATRINKNPPCLHDAFIGSGNEDPIGRFQASLPGGPGEWGYPKLAWDALE